jgi:hypothetical protein
MTDGKRSTLDPALTPVDNEVGSKLGRFTRPKKRAG